MASNLFCALRWRMVLTPAQLLAAEKSSPLLAYLSPSPDGSLNNPSTCGTPADKPRTPSLVTRSGQTCNTRQMFLLNPPQKPPSSSSRAPQVWGVTAGERLYACWARAGVQSRSCKCKCQLVCEDIWITFFPCARLWAVCHAVKASNQPDCCRLDKHAYF